jgi:hypothetical protein
MAFTRASKAQARLRIAIDGPSGSGKSYTGCTFAAMFAGGKPFAAIDTERGSLSKYADLFEIDVVELGITDQKHPRYDPRFTDFSPNSYITAMEEAQKDGYTVMLVDSITHEWNGKGGVLQIVDDEQKRRKLASSYQAWAFGKKVHQEFIDAMLALDMHLIVTMRSKMEHVLQDNNGKKEVKKVGMEPVQSDAIQYEFDIVGDMDIEHNMVVSKTRFPAISDKVVRKPGADFAQEIYAWATSGVKAEPKPRQIPQVLVAAWTDLQMAAAMRGMQMPPIDTTLSDDLIKAEGKTWREKIEEHDAKAAA